MKCLLVGRETIYSPGKIQQDSTILLKVGEALSSSGIQVTYIVGEKLDCLPETEHFEVILAMCQGPNSLDRLEKLAAQGCFIINSTAAIRSCLRANMLTILAKARILTPAFCLISTNGSSALPVHWFKSGIWLKRCDFHALQAEDVMQVTEPIMLTSALKSFHKRGLSCVIAQRHTYGELVKCYGVGSDIFLNSNLRRINSDYRSIIQRTVLDTVVQFGLQVFGVDLVITPDDQVVVIDVNDWPSFASCVDDAAQAIARYISVNYFNEVKREVPSSSSCIPQSSFLF